MKNNFHTKILLYENDNKNAFQKKNNNTKPFLFQNINRVNSLRSKIYKLSKLKENKSNYKKAQLKVITNADIDIKYKFISIFKKGESKQLKTDMDELKIKKNGSLINNFLRNFS